MYENGVNVAIFVNWKTRRCIKSMVLGFVPAKSKLSGRPSVRRNRGVIEMSRHARLHFGGDLEREFRSLFARDDVFISRLGSWSFSPFLFRHSKRLEDCKNG